MKNIWIYATKKQKNRENTPKPLDKHKKKWYHIYIIGDNYARLFPNARVCARKKDFSNRQVRMRRKFKQSEVLCYEKVQQSSCNAVSYHHCFGSNAFQCVG